MRFAGPVTGVLLGLSAGPLALAHTPYIAPSNFAPDRAYVSLTASLTEGRYFTPDFPLIGEGEFWATGPSGAAIPIGKGVTLKEFNVIDAPLPEVGTWRLSTGKRTGRTFRYARIDGKWRMIRGPGQRRPTNEAPTSSGPVDQAQVPAGAQTMESVFYIKSDTFVSRGAPSRGALKPATEGFELSPITHPNEIFAGEPFKFTLNNDGKGVGGLEYRVMRANDAYSAKRFNLVGRTDATGAAEIRFAEPGVYVLESDYPGSGVEPQSTVVIYTITLEVTP